MNIYYLEWSYGMHHERINVNKDDFYKVIDSLSNEFEIITEIEYYIKSYSIIDYYGNKIKIGMIDLD